MISTCWVVVVETGDDAGYLRVERWRWGIQVCCYEWSRVFWRRRLPHSTRFVISSCSDTAV